MIQVKEVSKETLELKVTKEIKVSKVTKVIEVSKVTKVIKVSKVLKVILVEQHSTINLILVPQAIRVQDILVLTLTLLEVQHKSTLMI